ncbi:hypothetical protein BD769DRAFT_1427899 [Suillus cothurnatus]|nr:hypothetical protein BD769DRAFT_1427899 [Suillus cothurnatus]
MEQRLITDSVTSEKYLRIASISIATYDYVLTLPAEWRFYRSQSSIFHISYVSIMAMIVSNYGYFSTSYTQQTCQRYYLVAPIFKAIQTMISQVILGIRTFNIVRRDRRIGIMLLLLYLLSTSAEWFTDLFHGSPWTVLNFTNHSCTLTNVGKVLSTWFYYLAVILYDVVIVTVSTVHLLRYNPMSSSLIYDGIGYFIVLSGKYTNRSEYIIRASVGFAVTWIMTQRILIHVRENARPDAQRLEDVIVARPTLSAQKRVMSGLRSQFESKSHSKGSKGSKGSKSAGDAEFRPASRNNSNDMELDVHVRVERSVMVDYKEESEHSDSWVK